MFNIVKEFIIFIFRNPKFLFFYSVCTLAVLIGLEGLLIAIGWVTNSFSLIQFASVFPYVSFTTALLFFLLSLTMVTALARWYFYTKIFGVSTLIISGLTLFLKINKIDIWIDKLFHRAFTEYPFAELDIRGETATSFFLLAISLLIITLPIKTKKHLWIIGISCCITIGLSITTIFYYIDTAHGLMDLTRMSALSGVGLLLSTYIVLYVTNLRFRPLYPTSCIRLFSFLAFFCLMWTTLSFFNAMKIQELRYAKQVLDRESLQMLRFIVHQTTVDKKSLQRMQNRLNNGNYSNLDAWKSDAQSIVNDINPLVSVLLLNKENKAVAKVVKFSFSLPMEDLNSSFIKLLNETQANWHPFKINDNKTIVGIYFPLQNQNKTVKYLVALYDLEIIAQTYPKKSLETELRINLKLDGQTLYKSDLSKLKVDEKKLMSSQNTRGKWDLNIWAAPMYEKTPQTKFPELFLIVGSIMAIFAGLIFHLYQKFKRQSFLLNKSNATKSLFLANVSHEIRTPLHGIIGTTSLLEFTELTTRQERLVHILKTSSNHLLDLINNLLDITKIESGSVELKYEPHDVRAIAEDAISLLVSKAEEKGLTLRLDFDYDNDQKIMIPARQLKQVMTNLIANAIKFTNEGIVTLKVNVIRMNQNEGDLHISVSDTGIGIRDDKKALIFEKFVQVHDDQQLSHRGTGLGLFITKLLVKEMRGTISFDSIVGQGTTFYISIPVSFATKGE